MEKHLQTLDNAFERLRAAQAEMSDKIKIELLLKSLPDTFDVTKAVLRSATNLNITFEAAKGDVRKRAEDLEKITLKVMAIELPTPKRQPLKPIKCNYCNKRGHFQANCYLKQNRNVNRGGIRGRGRGHGRENHRHQGQDRV